MSILINGMEMPTSCEDCPMGFSMNFGILCTPTHNIVDDGEISKKQDFCPLIEVPPHGDLVDAQEILSVLNSSDFSTYEDYEEAFDAVDNATVIIPAEPPKEADNG